MFAALRTRRVPGRCSSFDGTRLSDSPVAVARPKEYLSLVTGDVSLQPIPEAAQPSPPHRMHSTRAPPFLRVVLFYFLVHICYRAAALATALQLEELTQIVKSVKALKRQLVKA